MRIIDIKEEMKKELKSEEKVRAFIEKRKRELPPGSLQIQEKNGVKYYYQHVYVDGDAQRIYLDPNREEDRAVIEELKEKKTVIHGLPILRNNIKALQNCIPALGVYSPTKFPYGEELGDDYYLEDEVCLKEWLAKESGNQYYHPENLIYETRSGIMVRSKSEIFIADEMFDINLLFKNECRLQLRNRVVYPDFELINPVTFRLNWWEHFGMMDDPAYVESAMKKIDDYRRSGITIGNNLIVTWENRNNPLTRATVERALREHGLK